MAVHLTTILCGLESPSNVCFCIGYNWPLPQLTISVVTVCRTCDERVSVVATVVVSTTVITMATSLRVVVIVVTSTTTTRRATAGSTCVATISR